MNLFEPIKRIITVPAGKKTIYKAGNNNVYRISNKSFTSEFTISNPTYPGLFELENSEQGAFRKIYLKMHGCRAQPPENELCLKLKDNIAPEDFSADTEFTWLVSENKPEQTPNEIIESWNGQFRFKEDSPQEGIFGLRLPQLGALHAISGYFATNRPLDPATVVLPTGTGKTETMLSMLVYQQCKKMLVIVPSDALRVQISSKFMELGCLPEIGVVPYFCELPYVGVIKKGIHNYEEATELINKSNVLIATNSILNSSNQDVIDHLCSECTHLVIDEAHHVSANTWKKIRERFKGKKIVQFTATPFRNDGANLGGKIIFNYSMGEAQKANYFTKINLNPIEEYFDEKSDLSIAKRAISNLNNDIQNGFDHLLMARVKTKERAESVYAIYKRLVPRFNPIVVHSGYNKTIIKERLDKLLSRESKVVVCVDMLGEGYDLPNLKIAAIHDHHKSLAITLQFVGRFTRTSYSENLGESSVIMNLADPQVEGELENLYAQGADWDLVLRRLSEGRIDREIRLQNIIDSLKEKGNLHNEISLWNLNPSYKAILFSTSCEKWNPQEFETAIPKFADCMYSISAEENLLIVLAVQTSPIKWGSFKELEDTNYKLLIAHWDEELEALFIFSNDYKAFRAENVAEAICNNECELLCGEKIFNVFNGIEYPLARNLGAAQMGAISFTQYFGPNVTDGLTQIEKSKSSLSNIAALGYENGERVIWGCSQRKGKIWSPQKGGSIADWLEWSKDAWDKIHSSEQAQENITRNFLRPEKIDGYYTSGVPVSAQWGERLLTTYEDKVTFHFGDVEVPYYLIDLEVSLSASGKIYLKMSSDEAFSVYMLEISTDIENVGFRYELIEGSPLSIQVTANIIELFPDYMIRDPISIHYDDGSFSYNCWLVKVTSDIGLFNADEIESYDWSNIDIKKESMGAFQEADSIQYSYFKSIEQDYDLIINDDGKGESADLVAIKDLGNEILLTLVHCKYSSKNEAGARLKDLYEVCGQAQRSIKWKHLKLLHLHNHIKHREKLWNNRGNTRFLKGNISTLTTLKNKARTTPMNFSIYIVQPGLKKSVVTPEMLRLLGSTAVYIQKTTMAELTVIGS